MESIGRNDPCWCGSGKKYKKCHLDRENQTPVTLNEIEQVRKKGGSWQKCLHPEAGSKCDKVVRAHSVQRQGGLSRIAREGHVYQLEHRFPKILQNKGTPSLGLVGIKEATTFTGMCGFHDNETFMPIESGAVSFTPEQCFLFAYRSLCKEVYAKQAIRGNTELFRELDKGQPKEVQAAIQRIATWRNTGYAEGVAELETVKSEYDRILLESNGYVDLRYYAVELDRTPEIMCSGFGSPETDFDGNRIQHLADLEPIQNISFSLISNVEHVSNEDAGAGVFAWLGEQPAMECLMRSFHGIPDAEKPAALVRYVFGGHENFAISPEWYDARTAEEQQAIKQRILSGASWEYPQHDFTDDGHRTVDWQVKAVHISKSLEACLVGS